MLSRLQRTDKDDTPNEEDVALLGIDAKSEHSSIPVIDINNDEMIPLNALDKDPIENPPTLVELGSKHAHEEYYKATSLNVGHAGVEFHVDLHGLLVRKFVDSSVQFVAPASLQARIL